MAEMFELAPESITPDSKLGEDLDLDSIDAIDLVARLQQFLGRKIDQASLRRIRTLATS